MHAYRTTENQVVLNMDCTHKLTINGVFKTTYTTVECFYIAECYPTKSRPLILCSAVNELIYVIHLVSPIIVCLQKYNLRITDWTQGQKKLLFMEHPCSDDAVKKKKKISGLVYKCYLQ